MSWRARLGMLALGGCGRIAFDATPADSTPRDAAADAPAIYGTAFAHWKLDDLTGTTASDSTGNGHTMMLVNGPSWTTGRSGGSVSAVGATDYMIAPALDLSATQAITIAAWVRRTYTVGPPHTLFELSSNFNGATTGFGFFPDDDAGCGAGTIALGVRGNASYSVHCYAQPSSGVWHHLVAVYDKSQAGDSETALHIDGVLQTPLSSPFTGDNTNTFGTEPLHVFSRGGIEEFTPGEVDEIVIFARALTPAEIAQL
jgi:hypothetical protein